MYNIDFPEFITQVIFFDKIRAADVHLKVKMYTYEQELYIIK